MAIQNLDVIRADLSRSIEGSVHSPGDLEFASAIAIDNGRVEHQPHLVAVPETAEDVSKIVKYCGARGIPFTTKSGGHSAAGYCLNSEGLVVDLGRMSDIDFLDGNSRLRAGAGARWIQAYDFLRDRQSNHTVVGGGCAGVGLAGFLLGGGYSFISRSYGLGCDSVLGMQVVTAAGDIIELDEASREEQAKLYWAMRGSGGGNFAVATRFDIQLHRRKTERLLMGQVIFPFYRIGEILDFYNNWVCELDDHMAIYGMLRYFPDARFGNRPFLGIQLTPVFNGEFAQGLEALLPLARLNPMSFQLYRMSLPEWENFVGTSTQVKGHSAYIRSLIFERKALTSKFAEVCKEFMSRAPTTSSYVVWTHAGGKIRRGARKSSYAHRDSEFTFELKAEWDQGQPSLARPTIEWAVHFFDQLGRLDGATGAYINYIDPLLMDWKSRYYGAHQAALSGIRQHWDPKHVFRFQQSVDSPYITAARDKTIDLSPLSRTILSQHSQGNP